MEIFSILVQFPIVAAFMWFVLESEKRQAERDQQWRAFLKELQNHWQAFITDERMATVAGLKELSDHCDDHTQHLDRIGEIVIRHDEATDVIFQRLDEVLGNITKKQDY